MAQRRRAVLARWSRATRRGEVPTREAWTEDLRELGAIDLETALRLAEGGPRWPWIPPFELDQVEELARRTLDPAGADWLRRAAAHDLGMLHTVPSPRGTAELRPRRATTPPGADAPAHTDEAGPVAERPPTLRPSARFPIPRLRSKLWPVTLAGALGLLAGIFWDIEAERSTLPAPRDAVTKPALAALPASTERLELARALLDLAEALERSPQKALRTLFRHHMEPLLTLDSESISRRPEMAELIVSLAVLRSGGSLLELNRAAPLLAAVSCGWIGDAPRRPECPEEPPFEALEELLDWAQGLEVPTPGRVTGSGAEAPS